MADMDELTESARRIGAVNTITKLGDGRLAPYGELPADVGDGVMFCTYQSLIARNKANETRLDQLVAWCAHSIIIIRMAE